MDIRIGQAFQDMEGQQLRILSDFTDTTPKSAREAADAIEARK